MKSFFDFIGLTEATSSPCRLELDNGALRNEIKDKEVWRVPGLSATSIRRALVKAYFAFKSAWLMTSSRWHSQPDNTAT
ncbi:hypothetical protein J1TS3_34360 [Siminovitchia fordii]|uniref:Uncharacterized protein n=1 Tax=Siminovitchia fordii TaxID=254759 RepID=A0ABQ4K9A5_9BACI|nr:hypothetical protein J1TS3_34360 [Siminovitchia fordii]